MSSIFIFLKLDLQAYYLPNKDRLNYKVVVGAHVIRVLTEVTYSGDLTAVGVEFLHEASGKVYKVKAKREVELCAGYVFHLS